MYMYLGIIYAEAEPRHHVKSAIKKELIPEQAEKGINENLEFCSWDIWPSLIQ